MVSRGLRRRVFERDDGECVSCDTPAESGQLDVDHIKDKWLGGGDEIWNLHLLCERCHAVKSGQNIGKKFYSPEDWNRRSQLYNEKQAIGKQRKELKASNASNWNTIHYKADKDKLSRELNRKDVDIKNLELAAQERFRWHRVKVSEVMGWMLND